MNILKLFTAGSVDDGKSTLIGRLLYDTNSIMADQLTALQEANRKNDDGTIDLAILTDGLRAEREQGITIDVAYKYFQTEKRKFIIADTPGHIQYTRNMVTGASTADLAIILIDARNGIVEQTIRHSYLVSLLGIKHVVVCVNKMDSVNYSETVFDAIKAKYAALASQLKIAQVNYIPVSALKGDNVVTRSERTPWFAGNSLLSYLETIQLHNAAPDNKGQLSVQWVIRPQTLDLPDYRGYAGRVTGGNLKVNDPVTIFPSGTSSTIESIEYYGNKILEAVDRKSVIIHLKDNLDVSRGDLIASRKATMLSNKQLLANICWMDTKSLDTSMVYLLQHQSRLSKCKITKINYKVDINTLEKTAAEELKLNDIGRVEIKTADALHYDLYENNRTNGSAILIDPRSNLTVGALMFTS